MEIKAYAKINTGLDIKGIRPNGYHELDMVMQTVGLYDVLTIDRVEADSKLNPSDRVFLSSESEEIPLDKTNLIFKAAVLLMEKYDIKDGVRIKLEKNIPVAAGMAGGSTDCAATLRGMNEVFELGLSDSELMDIGVTLGADVPYCIKGGIKRAEGIGELLTDICDFPRVTFLIAKPDFPVSTKEVYQGIDEILYGEDKHLQIERDGIIHPDIEGLIAAIKDGDIEGISAKLGNILELYTIKAHPEIGVIKDIMLKNGARAALMSGSGPTVFGIFDDEDKAWEALDKVKDNGGVNQLFVVGGINNI